MHRPSLRATRWSALVLAASLPVTALAVHAQDEALPMAVEVAGIASGDVVTEHEIEFTVTPIGYELSAAHAGTPPVDGVGQYHVVLDGGLIDMSASPDASFSFQNVEPGVHTLTVVPARNDHSPVMEGAVAIELDYQPSDPLPVISEVDGSSAEAAISIVSPAAGQTVSGSFDLVVEVSDFTLSPDLFGKPNIDGAGHWHAFIDAAEGMGTMIGMAGSETFTIDSSALSPGPHTFIAVLTDNLHAPLDPPVMATVELEVAAPDGETAAGGAGAVGVSLQEWQLVPSSIELGSGTITFDATNDGSMGHALVIEGEGVREGTPDGSYSPGATQSFTVELAPGTYEIYCPVPGHKAAGMSGTVVVS